MQRQADLPFDFAFGACNTFQLPDEKALLCFSLDDSRSCHM